MTRKHLSITGTIQVTLCHTSSPELPTSCLSQLVPLQVTIARACQVAFTGLLCLFIVIGLLPVCVLRATMGPGVGIFSNLGFGITIIQAQFAWQPTHGYRLLWKDVSTITTGANFSAGG